ncbi:peptide deformylase [Rhodobacteraceae bacterium 2CG4]|uniref:Peptide deformylase-like n=1 Tax=Halovulum marinum TaxID=2662447 RepID=A0A6L5YUY6_9RHOB|nr:peptide deformylase [Halovulum marinum]MSU88153.1 peptide deformylase [Halovulum marinum]
MPRPYLIWPDKRLSQVAAPVAAVDDAVRALWDEMLEAMYAMPGVGLAAPQLGVGLRVVVVDAGADRKPLRMANPKILEWSLETEAGQEGSPNLPGLRAEVIRPCDVTVQWLDETGARRERHLTGLWARSLQHQVDHLEGRLFIDRLGPVKRRMLLQKHAKRQRAAKRSG